MGRDSRERLDGEKGKRRWEVRKLRDVGCVSGVEPEYGKLPPVLEEG
jgi:hypothetical protein